MTSPSIQLDEVAVQVEALMGGEVDSVEDAAVDYHLGNITLEEYAVIHERLRAALTVALTPPPQFPARILALLRDVANKTPAGSRGPWEDENGEPLQDDADAALRFIGALATQVAEPVAPAHLQAMQDVLTEVGAAFLQTIEFLEAFSSDESESKKVIDRAYAALRSLPI